MNTLVSLENYTLFFYNFLLFVVFVLFIKSYSVSNENSGYLKILNIFGVVLLIFLILYMGLRPISGFYFGDMRTYSDNFASYAAGNQIQQGKDVYFEYFMRWCSHNMDVGTFFLLCAFLYVFPLFIFSKKIFKEYWVYAFFALIMTSSFWAYGTNGIRNGIATSFFLLAISFKDIKYMFLFMILAILFHKSSLILVMAFFIAMKVKNPKLFFYFWLLCIPVSLVSGSFWEHFALNLGFGEEDRISSYLSGDDNEYQELFSKIGFRWDFLLYSASGVFAGWYFIIKNKYQDVFYNKIFSFYLITNAFWILVIRATFSNRFAYLSWFILGIVIFYPLLKNKFFEKQSIIIGKLILVYFALTYFTTVILQG